ncbi:hypothetical protein CBR_g29935 [Chara braunii]|uniref:UBC core domain-containing protein n=1 Tax=Chara braunii TaxID=69332 RepID=A0A388JX32_CHABU|nr:hypothetical protein CBR_g29935 [Chara braunii]|eukprot:GBG62328.1 hypothetical protein CBR_g29935 [Chara braunii]
MADKACVQRLQKEFKALSREPVPHVVAKPSPSDILEWHFVLEGSEGTPFQGGFYYGKLKFPPDYPFKPPGISMITPNGRFATHKKICMSMSDFHPESWNPMWSVSRLLLQTPVPRAQTAYMGVKKMDNAPTTGSINSTVEEKQLLAKQSLACNVKSATFRKLFPELVDKHNELLRLAKEEVERAAAEAAAKAAAPGTSKSGSEGGSQNSVRSRSKGRKTEESTAGGGGQQRNDAVHAR